MEIFLIFLNIVKKGNGAKKKKIFINIERRQSRPIDGVGLRARKTAGFFVIASREPV